MNLKSLIKLKSKEWEFHFPDGLIPSDEANVKEFLSQSIQDAYQLAIKDIVFKLDSALFYSESDNKDERLEILLNHISLIKQQLQSLLKEKV